MCGGGENSLFNCGRNPYQYGYISSTSDDAGVQCNEGCQYGYTWDGHRCVPPVYRALKGSIMMRQMQVVAKIVLQAFQTIIWPVHR